LSPKVTIYLPDELAESVRDADLNVSQLAQGALRASLRRRKPVDEGELSGVVERLRETEDEGVRESREKWRRWGVDWAKQRATIGELQDLDALAQERWTSWRVPADHSVRGWMYDMDGWDPGFRTALTRDAELDGFIDGALDVWEQTRPLL
jgi:hypothetical protein